MTTRFWSVSCLLMDGCIKGALLSTILGTREIKETDLRVEKEHNKLRCQVTWDSRRALKVWRASRLWKALRSKCNAYQIRLTTLHLQGMCRQRGHAESFAHKTTPIKYMSTGLVYHSGGLFIYTCLLSSANSSSLVSQSFRAYWHDGFVCGIVYNPLLRF